MTLNPPPHHLDLQEQDLGRCRRQVLYILAAIQLTVQKFNGKNYLEWAQSMKPVIDGKGRLGYLKEAMKSDPTWRTWKSENSLITAWLINSMEAPIGKTYLFVWDAVRETYSDLENSSQILELKTKLWQTKQGLEVTEYYNEMKALWHCGE